jgi:hypothetical protein
LGTWCSLCGSPSSAVHLFSWMKIFPFCCLLSPFFSLFCCALVNLGLVGFHHLCEREKTLNNPKLEPPCLTTTASCQMPFCQVWASLLH